MGFDSDDEDVHTFAIWKADISLEDYIFLKWFSMTSFFWILCSYSVCLYHTVLHLKRVHKCRKTLDEKPLHDQTIKILALPMVYGIMSFKAVCRMWQITIDHVGPQQMHWYNSWEERRIFLDDMYEANFLVGDLYEAYAFRVFGNLIVGIIQGGIQKSERLS